MSEVEPSVSQLVGIGALIDSLSSEFPDLSVSKVRFLESAGLLSPVRTPSGYRRYSVDDRERLHYILTVQRDQFLPLRVIKENLDAMSRGVAPPAQEAPTRPATAAVEQLLGAGSGEGVRLTEAEVMRNSGVSAQAWAEARSLNLLVPDKDGRYGAPDVEVARAIAGLAEFGLTPRHLRAVKLAAERHLGLVDAALSAMRGTPAERAEAAAAIIALSARMELGMLATHVRTLRPHDLA